MVFPSHAGDLPSFAARDQLLSFFSPCLNAAALPHYEFFIPYPYAVPFQFLGGPLIQFSTLVKLLVFFASFPSSFYYVERVTSLDVSFPSRRRCYHLSRSLRSPDMLFSYVLSSTFRTPSLQSLFSLTRSTSGFFFFIRCLDHAVKHFFRLPSLPFPLFPPVVFRVLTPLRAPQDKHPCCQSFWLRTGPPRILIFVNRRQVAPGVSLLRCPLVLKGCWSLPLPSLAAFLSFFSLFFARYCSSLSRFFLLSRPKKRVVHDLLLFHPPPPPISTSPESSRHRSF